MPWKREGGGGIVEGCVDYDCKESCEQGDDGEHNERERSKRKVVISGFGIKVGSGEVVLAEEVRHKVQAREEQEGGEGDAIECAKYDEGTKKCRRPK